MYQLIAKVRTYTGKDGVEKKGFNYYLETENGSRIQIKPSFTDDYIKMKVLAKVED